MRRYSSRSADEAIASSVHEKLLKGERMEAIANDCDVDQSTISREFLPDKDQRMVEISSRVLKAVRTYAQSRKYGYLNNWDGDAGVPPNMSDAPRRQGLKSALDTEDGDIPTKIYEGLLLSQPQEKIADEVDRDQSTISRVYYPRENQKWVSIPSATYLAVRTYNQLDKFGYLPEWTESNGVLNMTEASQRKWLKVAMITKR